MIEVKGVYKRYHNHHGSDWVLRDINFTIPVGVSVGVIGRNGAGKTTLLNLLSDKDSPDKGEITRQCRVSWPIGLSGGFQGSMTGRQNVKFIARIHGDENEIETVEVGKRLGIRASHPRQRQGTRVVPGHRQAEGDTG